MEDYAGRLSVLVSQLAVPVLPVFSPESTKVKDRTVHLDSSCSATRISRFRSEPLAPRHADRLCSTCLAGLAPSAGAVEGVRAAVAVVLVGYAVSSLERARGLSGSAVSTWVGRVLRAADSVPALGFSSLSSLVAEVAVEAKGLLPASTVSASEVAAAERAVAFLESVAASPVDSPLLRGRGDETVRYFAESLASDIAYGAGRDATVAAAALVADRFFGESPTFVSQLPDVASLPPEGVSFQDHLVACWRSARDEFLASLVGRWWDEAMLRLAVAPRCTVLMRLYPRGIAAPLLEQLGVVDHPACYLLSLQDTSEVVASWLRRLAERESFVASTSVVSDAVLETAIGLYDPRSEGRLSKMSAALEAAKAC